MVLRGGHPFDLHLAEPLTLTTIFWVLATGPSSVLSYHSVRENPLFLCKKNVEELKTRKYAFKSRSCLQEHSKETFFNPGQLNKCFLMWHWKFIPCCVFDMMDYYEALFQSDLLSLEVGLGTSMFTFTGSIQPTNEENPLSRVGACHRSLQGAETCL